MKRPRRTADDPEGDAFIACMVFIGLIILVCALAGAFVEMVLAITG